MRYNKSQSTKSSILGFENLPKNSEIWWQQVDHETDTQVWRSGRTDQTYKLGEQVIRVIADQDGQVTSLNLQRVKGFLVVARAAQRLSIDIALANLIGD